MLSSGGEENEGLRPAGLPHRLIVLLIPLLACLGTATAAQGRYGLRGPAPSRALAADGRRLVATSVAGGGNATAWDAYEECEPDHGSSESHAAMAGMISFLIALAFCVSCTYIFYITGDLEETDGQRKLAFLSLVFLPFLIFFLVLWLVNLTNVPEKCKTIPPPTLAPTVTFAPTPFPTRPTPRPTPFPTPQPSTLWPTAHPSLRPTAFGAKVVSGDLCISGMTEDVATSQKSVFAEAIEYYASTTADVWYSVSVDVSSGCLARRRRLQTASSDELTIHYDIHTDTSAAVNVAVAMGDLSPAAFDDALDSVVPNDLTNVFASVTLTNVGNPTLASGTHPVGTAAQKPQDGEDSEDGARSSPGNQAILLVGGVLSVFFCGYIYYVKKTHYDKEDDVSYQFYFVIGIALMDFYSDVFFAQSAVGSERSTVRTLGYVMIGWVVAVVTVNGVLLVTIYRKYVLEHNKITKKRFDQAHSGLFTILALLTLTSAELLAVFPWRGRDSRE